MKRGGPIGALCLVAILSGCAGVGGFGSVDPVTKAQRDLDQLQRANHAYQKKVGHPPRDGGKLTFGKALVEEGVLEEFPQAPESIRRPSWPEAVYSYEFYDRHDDLAGGSGIDSALSLAGITEEACRKYNEQFTPLGPTIPVYRETGYLAEQRTYCMDFGGNSRHSIILVHEIR